MTPSELQSMISDLKKAANGLDEPERSSRLYDIAMLETAIHDMALNEIVNKLVRINRASQYEMDELIGRGRDGANAHAERVQCFDQAVALLKAALGIVACSPGKEEGLDPHA